MAATGRTRPEATVATALRRAVCAAADDAGDASDGADGGDVAAGAAVVGSWAIGQRRAAAAAADDGGADGGVRAERRRLPMAVIDAGAVTETVCRCDGRHRRSGGAADERRPPEASDRAGEHADADPRPTGG